MANSRHMYKELSPPHMRRSLVGPELASVTTILAKVVVSTSLGTGLMCPKSALALVGMKKPRRGCGKRKYLVYPGKSEHVCV